MAKYQVIEERVVSNHTSLKDALKCAKGFNQKKDEDVRYSVRTT